MIIGISGKIGSGKDTVGSIIQYLIDDKTRLKADKISFDKYVMNKNIFEKNLEKQFNRIPSDLSDINFAYTNGWQIKKFADKLKDIVCLLIGCTREKLEDSDFKNTELGEEWNKYQLDSHWLNDDDVEFTTSEYFTSIEELNKKVFEWDMSNQTYTIQGLVKLTPRLLLQLLGTECGRNIIHPNIWVNALMSEYEEETGYEYNVQLLGLGMSGEQQMKIKSEPKSYNNGYPNWIITDMRFSNEMRAVTSRDGITIRVIRPVTLDTINSFHESETALDDAEFDVVIVNDGTIEQLIEKVRQILIIKKII